MSLVERELLKEETKLDHSLSSSTYDSPSVCFCFLCVWFFFFEDGMKQPQCLLRLSVFTSNYLIPSFYVAVEFRHRNKMKRYLKK